MLTAHDKWLAVAIVIICLIFVGFIIGGCARDPEYNRNMSHMTAQQLCATIPAKCR